MKNIFERLVLVATLITFCVIMLGAYVRLSDAGLGCPDWPGCYGHLLVPHSSAAQQAFPDKPLEVGKAWKEMLHRYLAGALGLLILAICIASWYKPSASKRSLAIPILSTCLLLLVIFQAALGMWTVTLLLKPVIVSLHLLGGMAILALLVWLASMRLKAVPGGTGSLRFLAISSVFVLIFQMMLGGWTSSNYAAMACTDFPTCHGVWWPEADFSSAFHLTRELGVNADGSALTMEALTAIHLTHRIGALFVLFFVGWLGLKCLRVAALMSWGWILLGLLLVQVSLGISNVLLSLPLPVAVAHNAFAALLLAVLVVINSKIIRGGR